jgi:hypothetical protein
MWIFLAYNAEHISNSLAHMLTNCVDLRVLGYNGQVFDDKHWQSSLKGSTTELSSLVMDAAYWTRIASYPSVLELHYDMLQ